MILVTSGGCKAPIDSVRHIGNFSSGRFGAEIVDALSENVHGEVVCMLAEAGSKTPSVTYHCENEGKVLGANNGTGLGSVVVRKEYKWYYNYLKKALEINTSHKPSIIISAAAISDFVPADEVVGKIKSSDEITIKFKKTEKVLKLLREGNPKAFIAGFKLLVGPTPEEVAAAVTKVLEYADVVVYNDLNELKRGNASRKIFYKDANGSLMYTAVNSARDLVEYIKDRAL